ncbi:MAG: hypothetical protein WAN03_18330 [Candidatus Sulfotelmatobacter sp.]
MSFQAQPAAPDIDVQIELVDRLSRSQLQPKFDSGAVWQLYEDQGGFEFDFTAPVFGELPYKRLSVDSSFSRATLRMSDPAMALVPQTAPLDYPLDELLIMHRLTQEQAIELHGAGIVTSDGVGNLFVGHSGAGKSTTTRLWTALEDVEVLSDDRIIVRRECVEKQLPHRAFGPVRNASVSRMRMYGTPWHGEAMYASPNSAPLARIVILEHGRGNILTPLSPSQAVAELFARSFVPFHRHEYVESALTFLQEVVEAVPVYRFAFEPDQRAVDTILNLRD